MTKRITAFALALLLVALMLCGCARNPNKHDWDRLIKVSQYNDCIIYVDRDTGVQYIWKYVGHKAGLTPILDLDGKPVPFPGFDAMEDRNG